MTNIDKSRLAIIAVAAVNGLLRLITCEPIFRRPWEREIYEYEWPAPHLAARDLPPADDVDDHARRNVDNAVNIREYLDNRLPMTELDTRESSG